jgi:heme exporter protein B
VNVFLAVLWKDLLTEWRSRERVVAMLVFSLLLVVIFQFSLPGGATPRNAALAPGLLWISYTFAALLGLNRAFAVELDNDALSILALTPADRGWVFLGKACANVAILAAVETVIVGVFALVFELDILSIALRLAGVILLGTVGFCAVGTFFAAMAVRTRFREVMLPLLMIPPLIPVLSASVRATADLLGSGELPLDAVQLLIVADAIYVIVAFTLFEYVLDE